MLTRPASAAAVVTSLGSSYSEPLLGGSREGNGPGAATDPRRPSSAASEVSSALSRWGRFSSSGDVTSLQTDTDTSGSLDTTSRLRVASRRRRRRGVRSAGASRLSVLSQPTAHKQVHLLHPAATMRVAKAHNGRLLRPDSAPVQQQPPPPGGWRALPGLSRRPMSAQQLATGASV